MGMHKITRYNILSNKDMKTHKKNKSPLYYELNEHIQAHTIEFISQYLHYS